MNCRENPASQTLADFIYSYYAFSYPQILSNEELCYDFINNEYLVLYRPLSETLPLSLTRENYDSIPALYTPLDASYLDSSGILKVADQPNLGNRGSGVLIGIADTGIDYRSPLFRNPDGSTRILGIWDQSRLGTGLQSSQQLYSLHYGTVYSQGQINQALQSSDPFSIVPVDDPLGHGTMMAALAAGSAGDGFSGTAPEASLAIVKLKPAKEYLRDFFLIRPDAAAYQENDIMMGIKYLLMLARERNMPLVILLGLGTNTGSHNGASPLGIFLTELSRSSGQIIVLAAGNETGRGHHYRGMLQADAPFEDVELRVGPGERGFTMELWARESELYTIGIHSPSGEETGRIPISPGEERHFFFLLEGTSLSVTYASTEINTGNELIFLRFQAPAAGIWKFRVYHSLSIQGEYHIWLPVFPFLSEETFFLRPDPDTTITDPGNVPAIITIAAYNHATEGIYLHSSRGFSRTGTIKPDLAAPGVDLSIPAPSPGSSIAPATGTSAAAAVTAGAAAILMGWNLTRPQPIVLNTAIAKAILIRGAGRRPTLIYPNREFGYGTLDLYNAFLAMRG